MTWALAQHLVVTTVLAGAVAVVCRFVVSNPVLRHALWAVVLVKLVMPPVLFWPWAVPALTGIPATTRDERDIVAPVRTLHPTVPPTSALVRVSDLVEQRRPVSRDNDTARHSGRYLSTWGIAVGLWLCGSLIALCVQVLRGWRMVQTVRRSSSPSPEFFSRVAVVAGQLALLTPRVRLSDDVSTPLVWSIGRPVLLWPLAFAIPLSERAVDALLVHELAHLKRRDHWLGWVELSAACLWWWNPVFWFVRKHMRENAELACDGWVMRVWPETRRAYADALISVCAVPQSPVPVPAAGVHTGSRRFFERRLAMIMRDRVAVRCSSFASLAVFMVAVVVLPAWAQRSTPASAAPASAPSEAGRVIVPVRPRLATAAPRAQAPQPTVNGSVLRPTVGIYSEDVPPEARVVLDRFNKTLTAALQEAEAKIARETEALIKELQRIQDVETKAGHLDAAIAVRERVRQLQSPAFRPAALTFAIVPTLQPGGHVSVNDTGVNPWLRSHQGQTTGMMATGTLAGSVWGTGIYTDDSNLGAAAVHAGILQPGQTALLSVTSLPGQLHYEGSQRHGVSSAVWNDWGGSYRINGLAQAGSATGSVEGQAILSGGIVEVVGTGAGTVWGTDVYTTDSSIAKAAVHAGLLKIGERGSVKVIIEPGQDRYVGSARNGVATEAWGSYNRSFRLVPVSPPAR